MGEDNLFPQGSNNPLAYTPFAQNMAKLSSFDLGQSYTPSFQNVASGTGSMQDYLNKPVGFSSEDAFQADSAKNANQAGAKESGGLMDLYSSLVDLLGGRGKQIDDKGAKWKLSAAGTPYRVVDVTPQEHRGLSGELIQDKPEQGFGLRPGIAGTFTGIDRSKEMPSASFNPNAAEIERRKQVTMAGGSPMIGKSDVFSPEDFAGKDPFAGAKLSSSDQRKWKAAEQKDIQAIKKKYGVI